jgi:hypothetical protein
MTPMPATSSDWTFAIDETGNFDRDDDLLAIAGVGLRGAAFTASLSHPTLREHIRRAAPWVPWPPHAWVLKSVAMQAIYMLRAPDESPADGLAAAQRIDRALAERLAWRGLRDTPEDARADYRTIWLANQAIWREATADARVLTAVAKRAQRAISDALTDFFVGYAEDVRLALAVNESRGKGVPDLGRGDAFLDLLQVLATRIADAGRLESDANGGAVVRSQLSPSARWVFHQRLGRANHMSTDSLGPVAEAASALHVGKSVVEPGRVVRFGPKVPAAWVGADFIANALRRYDLTNATTSLDAILERVRKEFGVAPVSPDGLPLLAASGIAHDWLEALRGARRAAATESQSEPGPEPGPAGLARAFRWAREQAERAAKVIR